MRPALLRVAAPARSTTGSAPVRSITVDGVPGSSPPSTPRRRLRRIRSRHVVEPARVGPAREVGARRDDGADRSDDSAPRPASTGTRTPIVSGRPGVEPGEATGRVRDDERERARQERSRASPHAGPPSSGTSSSSASTRGEDHGRRLDRVAALEPVEVGGRGCSAARRRRARRPCRSGARRAPRGGSRRTASRRRSRRPALDDPVDARQVGRDAAPRRSRAPRAAPPSRVRLALPHLEREPAAAARARHRRRARPPRPRPRP